MADNSLLVLGALFTLGSFVVYYYGRKRDTNNALLWSLFPFFHGLHEFTDYFSEINDNIMLIRIEVFLAIISSLVLLAVCIEFLGNEHSRYGKLTAFLLLVLFSYFLFIIPDDVFSELYNINHTIFVLQSTFFQFIYGILFVFISLIAIEYNLWIVKVENSRTGKDSSYITRFLLVTPISMILFIIFEGFVPTSIFAPVNSFFYQLYTLMEAIIAFLFLLIPIIFMSLSKPGLNSLIAFNPEDGRFLMAYDFNSKHLITVNDSSIDLWINTASFLSALSIFSKTDSTLGGELSSINTERGVFILSKAPKYSIAINTRTTTKNLQAALKNFMEKSKEDLEAGQNDVLEVKINPAIENIISEEFGKFI